MTDSTGPEAVPQTVAAVDVKPRSSSKTPQLEISRRSVSLSMIQTGRHSTRPGWAMALDSLFRQQLTIDFEWAPTDNESKAIIRSGWRSNRARWLSSTVATVEANADETRSSQALRREVKDIEGLASRRLMRQNKACLTCLSLKPLRLLSRMPRLHEVMTF